MPFEVFFFFPGCVYEYPIHIIISCISAHERGQPTASYNCTDWVWGMTGWNPRHQGNYCSFQRNWRNIPPSNKRNTKRFQHVTRLDLETQARISTEYAQKPPPKHWCQLPNGRVHHNVITKCVQPSLGRKPSSVLLYISSSQKIDISVHACETRQFGAQISKFPDLSLHHIPLMHERRVGLLLHRTPIAYLSNLT